MEFQHFQIRPRQGKDHSSLTFEEGNHPLQWNLDYADRLASLVAAFREYYLIIVYDPQQTFFPSKYVINSDAN